MFDELRRSGLRRERESVGDVVVDESVDRYCGRLQVLPGCAGRNDAFFGREEQFAPVVTRQPIAEKVAVRGFEQEPPVFVLALDPCMAFALATIAESYDEGGHRDGHRLTERSGEDCKIVAITSATLERMRRTAPLIAIGRIRNVSEFSDSKSIFEPIGKRPGSGVVPVERSSLFLVNQVGDILRPYELSDGDASIDERRADASTLFVFARHVFTQFSAMRGFRAKNPSRVSAPSGLFGPIVP